MDLPQIFFEVHSGLPREGPGDNDSTAKAFGMLKNLPSEPRILDIGCGPGMQTIQLAKLSGGTIEALDSHQPFLDQLNANAQKEGLSNRIKTVNGDMFNLKYPNESFNVVWCEGAIFPIGFERGLREWRPLLANKGYMVVSELSYLMKDVPAELRFYLNEMYAGLENSHVNNVAENVETAEKAGYSVLGFFTLPKKSWWDNYYLPIEAKLPILKAKHKNEPEALQYLANEEKEIAMYRKYGDYYGYEFYILQKT